MVREKERPKLELVVDSERLFLRGTGVDVEPALLAGHIALHLAEPTTIKDITLQFRGKARLPVGSHESLTHHHSTYTICDHEWSFLEGEKNHSRTLKAGRHLFPFQLQIGGSLPSSVASYVMGGASISYKLRAHVGRPGLSYNLQAVTPIHIVRSFSAEALEYQQTLELENTWPDKLMYSIMIPHKAWAAGDSLTALFKFSPLAKGVRVLRVMTTVVEITKAHAKSGPKEYTRFVGRVKHDIIDGCAILHSAWPSVAADENSPALFPNSPYSWLSTPSESVIAAGLSSENLSVYNSPISEEDLELNHDVVTQISFPIPHSTSSSQTLAPLVVSHRIRWVVVIGNLDGHTSELRCSLPIHILDACLLNEARSYTASARRLLLGQSEVSPTDESEVELPSYPAHVHDRVANMYLSDASTTRVANPWIHTSTSPTAIENPGRISQSDTPRSSSVASNLSCMHDSELRTSLSWTNSELLLSLSRDLSTPTRNDQPAQDSSDSNHSSQAERPQRGRRCSWQPSCRKSSTEPTSIDATGVGPIETFVHGQTNARPNLPGLFQLSIKPFTPVVSHAWRHTRSHSALCSPAHPQPSSHTRPLVMPLPNRELCMELLHRAFTEVPDYGVAARGFIGGVPPLTSMRGLPSYAETERNGTSTEPGQLIGRCAQAGSQPQEFLSMGRVV